MSSDPNMIELIKRCSFEKWYTPLRSETIRSYIIPLKPEFIHYLLEEPFIIPECPFPEMNQTVTHILQDELDGMAFIKLNFTAPTDSSFMGMNRSIAVKSFIDVIRFLKASDRAKTDLIKPFGIEVHDLQPVLIIKRWFNYHKEREFRAFIKSESVFAVTSRYLLTSTVSEEKLEILFPPFLHRIFEKYDVKNTIIDFYVSPKERLHIIDISPWNEFSSPVLFSWENLESLNDIQYRVSHHDVISSLEDSPCPLELQGGAKIEDILASMNIIDDIDPFKYTEFDENHLPIIKTDTDK